MNPRSFRFFLALSLVLAVASAGFGCGGSGQEATGNDHGPLTIADDIAARRAQFVRIPLEAELSHLSAGDREALDHLVKAGRQIDLIFKRQAWRGYDHMAEHVAELTGAGAAEAKDYFRINYGPWDRLTDFENFIGETKHPAGAGYYPEDMTKEEFEAWIAAHPEDKDAFMGLHTVIHRDGDKLVAVPYSQEFKAELEIAAGHLREAADATSEPTLAKFLRLRADAFFTNDYYESDFAWMDLAGDLEVVIGPYETYEDGMFGYKAAFETFLCVVNPGDSEALSKYKNELPWLERNLPIPDQHKNLDRGTDSPIKVVDEVFTAGDTRAGVQTIAFNLPNDERVREAKGSKKVMLKNIIRAKYDAILKPIAGEVLSSEDAQRLDFDAYFNFVLFHELVHGIGPGKITLNGRETEVRLELKELYSAFEEAKADVVGLHSLYGLADKGVITDGYVENLPWTVVAGFFRSARFGVASAHGQGVVMQINYLTEKGAVEVTEDGHFRPVLDEWRKGLTALTHDLLMIQAEGDYDAAKAFLAKYGQVSPAMAAAFERLKAIPVDVDPQYAVK